MVNDLLFSEIQKRGYRLEGKTRVWDLSDSKLWYLTPKQAQGFLDLEKTKGYRDSIIAKEIGLIKQNLNYFISEFKRKSANIIDLGCGDGKKAALFIDGFKAELNIRYCPVDISAYMVNKAARTVRDLKLSDVLEFKWNVSDFENLNNITPLFRDRKYKNHFMMLLGNTLGNFEEGNILHGIKQSMTKGDVLLIGNGINGDKKKDWIKEYTDPKINSWLMNIPILLGISPKQLEYNVRFVNSRIEESYLVKKDIIVKHLGKTLKLKSGDVIVTAISYKYTKDELQKLVRKYFSNYKMFLDKENSYALVFCKV